MMNAGRMLDAGQIDALAAKIRRMNGRDAAWSLIEDTGDASLIEAVEARLREDADTDDDTCLFLATRLDDIASDRI